MVFDEYHFGAWRDSAKGLFAKDDELIETQNDYQDMEIQIENFDENELPTVMRARKDDGKNEVIPFMTYREWEKYKRKGGN